ncbi:hypothetical protein TNCV_3669571 [Trichonephila clavipes]|nr:hypothetical protein TNCV_3669571 [Trichonephila clavipes]
MGSNNVSTPNLNAASISYVVFKLSDTGIGSEDQTQISLVSAHVTTLEENLKQQPLCQDSPKMFYLVPNRDPNPSSVRSCIIIHQNEVVTNSSSIWADIWIKGSHPDI